MLLAFFKKMVVSLLLVINVIPATSTTFITHLNLEKPLDKEFKAITYNIHSGKTKLGTPSLEKIAKLLKSENADFIALQEVDRYNIRSGLTDQVEWLSEQLDMHYVFGSNLSFAVTEYGNAILSKYPILEWGQIKLAYETEPRSFIWAKVKTENGPLYITSIHLGLDRKKRPEHFSIIQDFVLAKEEPVLLMGDFNSLPTQQDFLQLRTKVTGKVFYQEVPTYINTRPVQIDYIFGSFINDIEMYHIPSKASDHYPLILKFKINNISPALLQTVMI